MGFTEEEVIEIRKLLLNQQKERLEKEIEEIKEAENKLIKSKDKQAIIQYFKEEEE